MTAQNRSTEGTGLHARELVELAAVVAVHGAAVVRGAPRLSTNALQEYWSVSRCRLDRWSRYLKDLANAAAPSAAERDRRGKEITAWFEEIFVSEALTRVWTGMVAAHDRVHGSDASESIVRLVMLGHAETCHRAMQLLVDPRYIAARDAVALDQLRRRVERWTDLLVAHVASHVRHCPAAAGLDLCELATNPARARDFADDLVHQSRAVGGEHAWSLAVASLRAAFHDRLQEHSPNSDLNYSLAASIVACFSPELFDSTGAFHSLWVMRLVNHSSDAQGMIQDLLRSDEPAGPVRSRPGGSAPPRRFT